MTSKGTVATRRQFSEALVVCLVVLAAANTLIGRLTEHSLSRRILADAKNSSPAETVAIGNSLVRSGFVAEKFAPPQSEGGRSAAVNVAMGSSSPVEHLLLLRAALRENEHARLVLYGFYDFQLSDPVSFAFSDLIGNHDLLYFDEPEFARRYYSMNRYDTAGFEIARRMPLLAERSAVWSKVERLRRAISQQGMPIEATNEFGRVADFTLLEAKSQEEFVKHCQGALNAELNAPVQELIRESKERQLRVVFVLMPLPPRHVLTFYETDAWSRYQLHLKELFAKQNVVFLDASRWFPQTEQFNDALHLNKEGAEEFSRRLGRLCGDVRQLNSCKSQ
jgi:hypothetical protein